MVTLGLICIILAWALQFVGLLQGEREISWLFVVSYSVGVFLLITDGYLRGQTEIANLYILTLILSASVLLMIRCSNKKTIPSRKRR